MIISHVIIPAIILINAIIAIIFTLMNNKRLPRPRIIDELTMSKSTSIIFIILRSLTLITLVRALYLKNFAHAFTCCLSLFLFVLPSILQKKFKFELPSAMEIIILCFIFAAEILGEINSYYVNVSGWDTMLHTINGFLCAAVGFSLVDLLNRDERIGLKLTPLYVSIVAFCFSMTVGVMWEFGEFAVDVFLNKDAQKDTIVRTINSVTLDETKTQQVITISDIKQTTIETNNNEIIVIDGYLDIGLIDTMKDLFVNFIGAVVFCTIGYFYLQNDGRGKFAKIFIPTVNDL